MMNLLRKVFFKKKPLSKEDLIKKFDLVVESFRGGEENLLTKETMLLSYQGSVRKRSIETAFGHKELERINWKSLVRKQEVMALNLANKELFAALENYLVSSLKDYGLNLYAVRNSVINDQYQIAVDFKQKFHSEELFSDLKELSAKVQDLGGSLCLYKSKGAKAIWKLILSVDKNIQPSHKKTRSTEVNIMKGEV